MGLKEEILDLERSCLEELGHGLDNERGRNDKYRTEYYRTFRGNLYEQMEQQHIEEYGGGSGGEMKDKRYPAKMSSIRSSSAMTFNLLGNRTAIIKQNPYGLSEGIYSVAYEKKMPTLLGRNPANLDAYLCLTGKTGKTEAIFCEMKMMEWIINTPGCLNNAYKDEDNYFAKLKPDGKTSVSVFLKAITMLEQVMPLHEIAKKVTVGDEVRINSKKVHFFQNYDAWQMFKHTLGIYNMTSRHTLEAMRDKYNNTSVVDVCEMRNKFAKVTLLNVVFEPPTKIIRDEKNREKLIAFKASEHKEFELKFKSSMMESGVLQLFIDDCGFEFDIMYMSAKEFMLLLEMTEDRWKYLSRYRLEK